MNDPDLFDNLKAAIPNLSDDEKRALAYLIKSEMPPEISLDLCRWALRFKNTDWRDGGISDITGDLAVLLMDAAALIHAQKVWIDILNLRTGVKRSDA